MKVLVGYFSSRRTVALGSVAAVLLCLLTVSPVNALSPGVAFSSGNLPTWQTNGIVWAVGQSHGKVIAGGTFTEVRPPDGGAGTPLTQNGLVILDAESGAPDSCQLPLGSATATVRAITTSPDGNTVYIAGEFGSVGGVSVSRVAAIDVQTCKVLPFRTPQVSSTVRALALKGNTLYLAGDFQSVGGTQRLRFAAVDVVTRQLLPWKADADAVGRAVAVSPDGTKVAIGGAFFSMNGAYSHSIAVVDGTTGANLRTYPAGFVDDTSATKAIINGNDGKFYVGQEGTGGGIFDGRFAVSWDTLDQVWRDYCLGATQALLLYQGTLYSGSHAHNCSPVDDPVPTTKRHSQDGFQDGRRNYLMAESSVDAHLLGWDPHANDGTGEGLGPRALTVATGRTTGKDYLWVGGEFTKINGLPQQSLTRFGTDDNTTPPVAAPAAEATSEGAVQVRWRSVVDPDDSELTYDVYRATGSGAMGTTPVWSGGASSVWWKRPQLTFVDTNVTPGTTYSYRVQVSDGTNRAAKSALVSATATAPAASYSSTVRSDNPVLYWSSKSTGTWLQDAGASTSANRRLNGQLAGGTLTSSDSAITNDTTGSGSLVFDGSDDYVWNDEYAFGPSTFTEEAWIKTTTTKGGLIMGYGSGRPRTDNGLVALSGTYDRNLYMEDSGFVNFGVNAGGFKTLRSPTALNNGGWHHLVGVKDAGGMSFFVDGKKVGSNTAQGSSNYYGDWHLGGDQLRSWPGTHTSNFFAGQIDEAAVYPGSLTARAISEHYRAGGGNVTVNPRPTDTYGGEVFDADPSLYWRLDEGSGTTARDSSYFGAKDGTYGTGVTKGVPGVVSGHTAVRTNGSLTNTIAENTIGAPSKVFSAEAWFNTGTATGGKIFGFENTQTGTSATSFDKQLYMSNDGHLNFGTQTGTTKSVVRSTAAYNDSTWHHAVTVQDGSGMKLYVDGALVDSNGVSAALTANGYWRVGGGTLTGWANAPTSSFFTGSVDEFAVYPTTLTAAQVSSHYGSGLSDNAPPSAPTDLNGSASGGNVSLTWTASTDNVQVARYRVYRDVTSGFTPSEATLQGESTTPSFSQTAPASGTYFYKVVAVDGVGNESPASADKAIVVPDTTPPSTPAQVTATLQGGGGVTVAWQPSTDNVAVTSYDVYRGSSASFTPDASSKQGSSNSGSYADTAPPSGTQYYKVIARDAAGNSSGVSDAASVFVPDNQPPTAPQNLAAVVTDNNVALDWDDSMDDGTVAGYTVYRGASANFALSPSTKVADTTTSDYADNGRPGGTSYYKVVARDTTGNVSAVSNTVQAVVDDNVAPTAPTDLTATVTGSNIKLDWTAGTDNFGVTGYSIYRGTAADFVPGTTNKRGDVTGVTYTDQSVPAGTYYYKVVTNDGGGNSSAPAQVSATMAAPPGNPVTITVNPTADAMTAQANPGTMYGTTTQLSAKGGSTGASESFLRFDVPAAPAGTTLTSATVTVRTSDDAAANSTDSTQLRLLDSAGNASWTESGITWNNRPLGTGPLVATLTGTSALNTVYSADASTSVLNGVLGTTVTLKLVNPGTDNLRLWSNEKTASSKPRLTVTFTPTGGGGGDTTAPSVPTGFTSDVSGRSVALGWNASTDNVGVTSYSVYRGATAGFTVNDASKVGEPTTNAFTDSNRPAGTSFYRVIARDAAGNASDPSAAYQVDVVDSVPPTDPDSLTAAASSNSIKLDWTASSDSFGVTGYSIYRGTTAGFTLNSSSRIVPNLDALTYTDSGLAVGTYYYRVVANDASGNASGPSPEASATVAAPPAGTTTIRVNPTADTYVAQASPTVNYGTNVQLSAKGGPTGASESYLRFTLPSGPPNSTLTGVAVSVRTSDDAAANSGDSTLFQLFSAPWDEATVTWNSRPTTGVGATVATLTGTTAINTPYTAVGDPAALAPFVGGTVALRMSGTGTDNLRLWSNDKTSATYKPALVLTFTPNP